MTGKKRDTFDKFTVLVVPSIDFGTMIRAKETVATPSDDSGEIRIIAAKSADLRICQPGAFTKKSQASVVNNLRALADQIEKATQVREG